jgi:hypothetical protein
VDGWGPVCRVSHAARCATIIVSLVRLNRPSGSTAPPTKGTSMSKRARKRRSRKGNKANHGRKPNA